MPTVVVLEEAKTHIVKRAKEEREITEQEIGRRKKKRKTAGLFFGTYSDMGERVGMNNQGRIPRSVSAMAQHQRIVGDYVLTHQIGAGSFAVVWKAKHRLTGTDVAIKEIALEKLNNKLQESLRSEIDILKKTNHPNIIRLHDTIWASNHIFLVLEYCAGGDLAAYIHRYGRVSEMTARHFMRQLGAGLQILRANNLIHRDLKPQNLLLSSNDGDAVLKIADFGFARSLQPQGMAETLCGSPLYMAPEILDSKRYDAKADLWSVGTILYQLVTGQPPFVGQSPMQLLQNIKSNELQFPASVSAGLHSECIDLCRKLLRKDPVERLSFEEFFTHRFIAQPVRQESGHSILDRNLFSSGSSKSLQEEQLPFLLDEDPPLVSPASTTKKVATPVSPPFSFLQSPVEKNVKSSMEKKDASCKEKGGNPGPCEIERDVHNHTLSEVYLNGVKAISTGISAASGVEHGSCQQSASKGTLMDSMECLEREYVLVNVPLTSTESMSLSASDQSASLGHPLSYKNTHTSSANTAVSKPSDGAVFRVDQIDSPCSPSDVPHCSLESDTAAATSSDQFQSRLQSLQNYAEVITEVATDKLQAGQHSEALSIQLVCLAVWKEALDVCHKWAYASLNSYSQLKGDMEGYENTHISNISPAILEISDERCGVASVCSHVEQKFIVAVEHAERTASHLSLSDEVPDAMENLFQVALSMGINAAVDEVMGNNSLAALTYSKAATLLHFLVSEAVLLPVSPRLVLSASDRQRLTLYIKNLIKRQSQCLATKVELG